MSPPAGGAACVGGGGLLPLPSLCGGPLFFPRGARGGSPASARAVWAPARKTRHTADRIAAALLAPDPRFGRTTDGRWTVATPPSSASPVLEIGRASCRERV